MKLHLPLLQPVTSPGRQAGRLQNTAHAPSGLLLVCMLWCAVSVMAGELEEYPEVGPTPPLVINDLGGNPHRLDDYRGQVVLLNFWASWCPPCIHEMPVLERLKQRLSEQPFEILAVNVGEKKYRVWKFLKLINFDLPVLLDEHKDTFNAWGASVLPTSFLLDKQGHIRYRVQGDIEWDNEDVIALIEALINEEENKQ